MKKRLFVFILPLLLIGNSSNAQLQTSKSGQRNKVSMPFPDKLVKPASGLVKQVNIPGIRKPAIISADSLAKNVRLSMAKAQAQCRFKKPKPTLTLKAQRTNALLANVQWETKYASEATGFNVERSFADTLHFETVNFRRVSASKGTKHNYSIINDNSYSGTSYYRIRQLNENKTYSYSNITSIPGLNQLSLKIYPNPATTRIYLETNVQPEGKSVVSIYDAKGQVVIQENFYLNTGSRSYKSVDVSRLASGLYQVKLVLPGNSAVSGRFIKE